MSLRVLLYSITDPREAGGVQVVVKRLRDRLRAQGHAVTAAWLSPSPDPTDESYALPRLRRRRGVPTPRSILGAMPALLHVARALSRHRPQIVNVHYVTCECIYFLLLRPFYRYKLVLSVHGSDVLRPTRWDADLLPRLLRRADAITVVSLPTAAHVRAYLGIDPDRLRIISNGVDYDFWSATSPPHVPVTERPMTVLTVGRLLPVKGQDVLLRAFAMVVTHVPRARLVIIGDGTSRAELLRLAGELHLEDAVEFAGEHDAAGVRARLGEARVFALPSRSEGLPLALLEAMAAGVPAVATCVGGVPDVLVSGAGLMVPPDDPAALAEALSAVLLDAELASALAERGQRRARDFSAAAADAAYQDLFLSLASVAPREQGGSPSRAGIH